MKTDCLILQNLKKTYGNKTAVNIASLEIQPRTFTCIVGKSGCGKTTLLRLLAGLETPDAVSDLNANVPNPGNSTTNCNNITNNADKNTSSCITGLPDKTAPVFQEPRLMPWLTVKQNIMFSLKGATASSQNKKPPAPFPQHAAQQEAVRINANDTNITNNDNKATVPAQAKLINNETFNRSAASPDERCKQLLHELELTEAADLYPAQLSGGMAQRVSLGRTLFYDPDLILMDEPFSALDYFTRRNLQDMVMRLFRHQEKTILFVTHDVEEALLLGDRILVMENGSIKKDIPVTLPFPRKAADTELQKMRQTILELLA